MILIFWAQILHCYFISKQQVTFHSFKLLSSTLNLMTLLEESAKMTLWLVRQKSMDTDFKLVCPLENHWKWKLGGSAKVIPILYTIWAYFIKMHFGRQHFLTDIFYYFKLTCPHCYFMRLNLKKGVSLILPSSSDHRVFICRTFVFVALCYFLPASLQMRGYQVLSNNVLCILMSVTSWSFWLDGS